MRRPSKARQKPSAGAELPEHISYHKAGHQVSHQAGPSQPSHTSHSEQHHAQLSTAELQYQQFQQLQQQQRPQRSSIWKKIGFILLGLFILLFILNYLLPAAGVGGCIGIIVADGEITSSSGYGVVGSQDFVNFVKQAEQRPDVKGIMIEINSPGGSAVASREIYEAIRSTKKPTVAHIGEMGASGGYYIALGADKIVADPLAITGSIGVRTTIYEASSLLAKIGINATVVKSGELKDMGDVYRPMTDEEKKVFMDAINEVADDFRTTIIYERSNNSRFSTANLDKVMDARILTGKQAYELGLVDELGSRQEARNAFGKELGLGLDPQICYFKPEAGFLSSLFSSMGRGIGETLAQNIKTETTSSIEYK